VFSTRLHVYTCASLTDILARILVRKSARVGQVGGQVGKDRCACSACGKLNKEVAGHANFRARILTRKSARMSVSLSVSLSVPWNSSLTSMGELYVLPLLPVTRWMWCEQMNARNLAMCFSPSLFDACGRWKSRTSSSGGTVGGRAARPRRRRARTGHTVAAMLNDSDLQQHHAQHECLATMITNAKDLFTVSHFHFSRRRTNTK